MATAIIGIGNIGGALARHLVRGGEPVVLAAKDEANAAALAQELGELARAASVEEAIAEADAVVFAVWLDTIKELIAKDARPPGGQGGRRSLEPDRVRRERRDDADAARRPVRRAPWSPRCSRRRALREGIRHTRGRSLASAANREPRRAVLFYATDDDAAAAAIERLIGAAGFDPLKVGGVADAGRIEVPGGDLHQNGGLNGQLLDLDQARAAIAERPVNAAM